MDKNILGGLIATPLLLVLGSFGGLGGGAKCNYTKPELVFGQACRDDDCRAQVRKHLPDCMHRYSSQMITSIRHEDGVAVAPKLTLAVMDKLTDCVAQASYSSHVRDAVDFSDFREVGNDVRGDKAKAAGGGLYLYPVVGQTTFLYGPA